MERISEKDLQAVLEDLTGQKAPLETQLPETALRLLQSPGAGLGYSQLNELLILLGFDRITRAFYQYLVDGSLQYKGGATIGSLEQLTEGVTRFRKAALLFYGNIKFAFKTWSRNADVLESELGVLSTVEVSEYERRHDPVRPIDQIPGEKTYYLGYLVERELRQRIDENPDDAIAKEGERIRVTTVARGKANHEAYLTSDHLDVYVATSMRQRHEFLAVSRLTSQIFSHPELVSLKLRWFDPTQAYCKDRVDKGLSEALMLRRAQCTIYFAQETDTLGKDSELASTLAQGKTVIAFVPDGDDKFTAQLLADLKAAYPERVEADLILEQLRTFEPGAAWTDGTVRAWLEAPAALDLDAARQRLKAQISRHYDSRALTLKQSHPLGIQVNLDTGVANGVLVVRSVEDCARLVRRIVTRTLEFDLTEEAEGGFLALREKISGSIYRVMTRDMMLMNSFWNFYLEPSE